jgi:hypothetical protein
LLKGRHMKTITLEGAMSGEQRRRGGRGTSGVYGLVESHTGRIRYVGSSVCIEHRLYSHWHSTKARAVTPKEGWLAAMRLSALEIHAVVLEEMEVGDPQGAVRHEAESRWIAHLVQSGQADLNVTLAPLGSPHTSDSYMKKLRAENKELKAEVAILRAELAAVCGLGTATCNAQCNVAPRCTLRSDKICNATQRHPMGTLQCCNVAGSKRTESADFNELA